MKHKRNAPSRQEREEFEAYGEYSYAYLHDRQVKEGQPDEPVSPPPAASAAASEKRRQKRHRGVLIKMVVLLAALCILIIVLQETVFRLDAVYVIGLKEHSPQQVVSASVLYKGRNKCPDALIRVHGFDNEAIAYGFKLIAAFNCALGLGFYSAYC